MKSHQIPIYIYIPTKWGPQTIAKLVNITPMSLWFMVLITIVTGANLSQLITGGGHIAEPINLLKIILQSLYMTI